MTDDNNSEFSDFEWTEANRVEVERIKGRYPKGREQSAIMPLLWLAQYQMREQTGTAWLPLPVVEYVAHEAGVSRMRALEVLTFYTMYNREPVGRYHVNVCGTTPCMLRGSDDILRACADKGLKKGEVTADGLFSLVEVECIGCCANAPVVQINDDNFEDLTYESMTAILDDLAAGREPRTGSQTGRTASCPEGGPTTLKETV